MSAKLFIDGKTIIKEIQKYHHKAYFVGGCVRDLILKRPIGDIDIATSASPELIQKIFPKVIPVGIEHGTVIVRHKQVSYEVTTFRLDGNYSDQRHPDSVQFIDKIDEDLQRRDFTINALAMDTEGLIIDLFNGKEDLQQKLIRTVGNGYDRFTEDPLRIIRALRFSSQLGFTIEQETLENIKKTKAQIETIAMERITNEFTKLFAGKYVDTGIEYLKRTEIYNHLPIMVEYPYIINRLPKNMEKLESFGEVLALFHHIEPDIPISKWIKTWKCSNKVKNETIALTEAFRYYEINGLDPLLVYQLPTAYYNGFIRLLNNLSVDRKPNLQDILVLERGLAIHSKQELMINGRDLIALFPDMKQGPWIHELLTKIEKEVVFNRLINTNTKLKEWIQCNPPVIS